MGGGAADAADPLKKQEEEEEEEDDKDKLRTSPDSFWYGDAERQHRQQTRGSAVLHGLTLDGMLRSCRGTRLPHEKLALRRGALCLTVWHCAASPLIIDRWDRT